MLETSDIMDRLAKENGVDKTSLQIYQFFSAENSDAPSMLKAHFKLTKYGVQKEGGFPQLAAKLAEL